MVCPIDAGVHPGLHKTSAPKTGRPRAPRARRFAQRIHEIWEVKHDGDSIGQVSAKTP